jgi:hypothetical protein
MKQNLNGETDAVEDRQCWHQATSDVRPDPRATDGQAGDTATVSEFATKLRAALSGAQPNQRRDNRGTQQG